MSTTALSPVGQNLIQNGGFEASATCQGQAWCIQYNNRYISPWYMAKGSTQFELDFDVWTNAEGRVSMDLSGDGPNAIAQDVVTVPGNVYRVVFQLYENNCGPYSNHTGLLEVSGGSPSSYAFWHSFPEKNGWTRESFDFTASSSKTTVTFSSTTQSGCGPVIDDVNMYLLSSLPLAPVGKSLIQNGGFEANAYCPDGLGWCIQTENWYIAPWYMARGSQQFELDFNVWPNAEGRVSMDLSGDGPNSIAQDILLSPGTLYRLTFKLYENNCGPYTNHTGTLQITGVPTMTFWHSLPQKTDWTTESIEFVATSYKTTVTFTSTTNSGCGPVLDDVNLFVIRPVSAQQSTTNGLPQGQPLLQQAMNGPTPVVSAPKISTTPTNSISPVQQQQQQQGGGTTQPVSIGTSSRTSYQTTFLSAVLSILVTLFLL